LLDLTKPTGFSGGFFVYFFISIVVNLYNIPTHVESPGVVNAVVEITKGTSTKYEYDHKLGAFRLDRCLHSAMVYPTNYGFIPSTLAGDGDPLDILIYTRVPIARETVVECNVLGMLDMRDDGCKDYKVIGIPTFTNSEISDLCDVKEKFLEVTLDFFENYKKLAGGDVEIHGWYDKKDTLRIIEESTIISS
jgi:inorganic pyrophosphatase